MQNFVTLDATRSQDIEKAIQLLKEGYFIFNMGLNLIILKK
jgi:hypothetical protein